MPTTRAGTTPHDLAVWPPAPPGEGALYDRVVALCEEGSRIAARFEAESTKPFESFVPAAYERVFEALLGIRADGGRFLELGSATGVITIMADMLGFEACGIEIDPDLVTEARRLARRHASKARFTTGSYLPAGYRWVSPTGDTRLGTFGIGEPAFAELGYELGDFDWVYAYPWPGEGEVILDMMRRCGGERPRLLFNDQVSGIRILEPPRF